MKFFGMFVDWLFSKQFNFCSYLNKFHFLIINFVAYFKLVFAFTLLTFVIACNDKSVAIVDSCKDNTCEVNENLNIDLIDDLQALSGSSDDKATLSWSIKQNATYYEVYQNLVTNHDTANLIYTVNATESADAFVRYRDINLTTNTIYYWVKSCNAMGCTTYSNQVSANISIIYPITPSISTLLRINSNQININWSSVANANYYRLYRSTSENGTYAEISVNNTTISFQDAGLKPSTKYFYKLKACFNTQASSCSGYSNSANATTLRIEIPLYAIPILSVINSNQINANWLSIVNANYYRLYRSTTNVNETYVEITENNTATSFQNTGLNANTKYFYKFKACFNTLESTCSDFSNSANITTSTIVIVIPAIPTAPTLSVINSNQINANWSSVANANYYRLYKSTSENGTYVEVSANNTTISFQNTDLSANTKYFYKLKACFNTQATSCSGYSNSANATTHAITIPSVPTAPTLSVVNTTAINVNWSSVVNANYYRLYRSTSESGTYVEVSANNTTTSLQNAGLNPSTKYFYKLKACFNTQASSCSGYSNSVNATTHAITIPSVPTVPTFSAVSISAINVNWLSVDNASYYRLYRSTSENGIYVEVSANNATTSFQNTGLNSNMKYFYKLKACFNIQALSCSNFSNIAQTTTLENNNPAPSSMSEKLNDTGISWGGNYKTGNNNDAPNCDSVDTDNGDTPLANQDCHNGRDAQATAGTLTKIGGGLAGFDFTKLTSDGTALNNQNATWDDNGTEASGTKWSCVRDNYTGYVWEVKNSDGATPINNNTPSTDNIHHKDNRYQWGGLTAIGKNHVDKEGTYYDNWNTLVNGANQNSYGGKTGLCGYTNWKVPTLKELTTIVHYSILSPSIDADYFPNTQSNEYWSSSPNYVNEIAWVTNFNYGKLERVYRSNYIYVRLVYTE